MASHAAVVVRDLRKVYQASGRPALCAVDGISFDIPKGECFGLLGPNGAGKSTSMNCITGFYPVTAGEIRLLGIDVHAEPRKARRPLGSVFAGRYAGFRFQRARSDDPLRNIFRSESGARASEGRGAARAFRAHDEGSRSGRVAFGRNATAATGGARAPFPSRRCSSWTSLPPAWIRKSGACCGTSSGNAGHKASQFFFRPTTWRRRSASAIVLRSCTTGRSSTAHRLRS